MHDWFFREPEVLARPFYESTNEHNFHADWERHFSALYGYHKWTGLWLSAWLRWLHERHEAISSETLQLLWYHSDELPRYAARSSWEQVSKLKVCHDNVHQLPDNAGVRPPRWCCQNSDNRFTLFSPQKRIRSCHEPIRQFRIGWLDELWYGWCPDHPTK